MLLALLFAAVEFGAVPPPPPPTPMIDTSIQEDDPRWDCYTMGNLICGPSSNPPIIFPELPNFREDATNV